MNKNNVSISSNGVIYDLSKKVLEFNGCNEENANAVAETVTHAERDGSISHGLFRIPGYVAALKSKKAKGNASPSNIFLTQNVIRVDGDYGFAPTAIKVGIPALVETTNKHGVGVLTITNTHHFAALWPETEALAEQGLIGILWKGHPFQSGKAKLVDCKNRKVRCRKVRNFQFQNLH